jgi:hypothetical protein
MSGPDEAGSRVGHRPEWAQPHRPDASWRRTGSTLCSHWRARASAELGGGSSHSGMLTVKTFLRYEGRTREPLNLKAEILGMRGVIHHLDLTVKDPEQVFGFYDRWATAAAPSEVRLEWRRAFSMPSSDDQDGTCHGCFPYGSLSTKRAAIADVGTRQLSFRPNRRYRLRAILS